MSEPIQRVLDEIREHHADKAYHSLGHTSDVIRRATAFLDVVREEQPDLVTQRDYELVQLAAAYHDREQAYNVISGKRVRFAPQNEYKSAESLAADMRLAKTPDGKPFFSEEDIQEAVLAVHHTIAAWDPENATVYQPMLTENSSLVARAVAYADIGTAAIDGPEAAIADANNLFIEDNVDLTEQIRAGAVSTEDQTAIRNRILEWTRLQIRFIMGRQNRLETELAGLSTYVKAILAEKLFSHFGESLIAMQRLLSQREQMSFEELLKSAGYAV